MQFKLKSNFQPTGDQPQAIEKLTRRIENDSKNRHTLLGVTGSGKTFTMANVIQKVQRPTLIIAHNKTLAGQLYQEFRDFFPDNAVSYFVSYYDYYQPEAYIPTTDTYIEKEATINDEIDKLRLAATTNLLTRPDTIVVASVSCIYNLGSPVEYGRNLLRLMSGQVIPRNTILLQLGNLQYKRSTTDLNRGTYRLRGDTLQIWPAYESKALRINTLENEITSMAWIDPVSGTVLDQQEELKTITIYPAKHYVVAENGKEDGLKQIEQDLQARIAEFKQQNKVIEAYRLEQKVRYDIEMIREFDFVNGIENYSRYFDGRQPGQAPYTLLDYFAANAAEVSGKPFLTIIDESHITLPQIKGMFNGDQARKQTLIEYGFRLPSAKDNRPLTFDEFMDRNPELVAVSATPAELELSLSGESVEQLIRPTGLVDPEIELRPIDNQIEDLIVEILARKQRGQRSIVTTLTKKMAETLTDYLNDQSKIDTLLRNFKRRQQTESQFINPDKIITANQVLAQQKLNIGPIPDHFYATTIHQVKLNDLQYPKVAYLHSDVDTLDRSDILDDLRRGEYDVVIGINLLREGLDLPEVSLVAILDADKEGFLRSASALIQTIGRAARHVDGTAVLLSLIHI